VARGEGGTAWRRKRVNEGVILTRKDGGGCTTGVFKVCASSDEVSSFRGADSGGGCVEEGGGSAKASDGGTGEGARYSSREKTKGKAADGKVTGGKKFFCFAKKVFPLKKKGKGAAVCRKMHAKKKGGWDGDIRHKKKTGHSA